LLEFFAPHPNGCILKDNHAWFRFDAGHVGGPIFHARDQADITPRRTRWRGAQ
jgi:hypothetical protein